MSGLKTYIASLPGLTDEELVTEARSAGSLLSRARKSGTKRAVANLEKMRVAIQAEKAGRASVKENPGESTVSSYAGKIARMTNSALRAENKKLKNMLRESAAPVRHFGTEGLLILKQMITATEKEMRGRSLIPNPCRPMKNPVRLAYKKTEPYDAILYEYEDGTWFFEVRDPGLGGTLVYDDHDGRSRAGAEREAIRVIKREFEENPKKKAKKKRMSAAGRGAVGAGIGALALGPIGAVGLGYAATKYRPVEAEENPGKIIHTAKTAPYDIRLFMYDDGKFWYQIYDPSYKMIIQEDKKSRSESAAAKHAQCTIDKELLVLNPRTKNPMWVGSKAVPAILKLAEEKAAAMSDAELKAEYKTTAKIGAPAVKHTELRTRTIEQRSWSSIRLEALEKEMKKRGLSLNPRGRKGKKTKKNPYAESRGKSIGVLWTGSSGARGAPLVGGKFDEFIEYEKTSSNRVRIIGYAKSGSHKGALRCRFRFVTDDLGIVEKVKIFEIERGKRRTGTSKTYLVANERYPQDYPSLDMAAVESRMNPKKKTKKKAKKETLIGKSRRLWDDYVEKPTKKALKSVLDHLEDMEASSAKTVKAEWRRAKRAARAEAKRLRMKV